MDARTTPFTRMYGLSLAYRADRDMAAALDEGSPAGDRVLDRLLRVLCLEPADATPPSLAPSEPLQPS